jgi:hypothetical protein
MPFDYEANLAAIQNCLNNHNTTTASPDLSAGLTTRVKNVVIDDPDVAAIQWDDLPAIFIRMQNATEEAAGLGPTGPSGVRKTKEASIELIGMYMRDGAHTTSRAHHTEVYRLAENLEGVFQAEFTLSGTAMWCHPAATNFGAFQLGEGTRVKGFVTNLRARYHFR